MLVLKCGYLLAGVASAACGHIPAAIVFIFAALSVAVLKLLRTRSTRGPFMWLRGRMEHRRG